MVHFVVLLSFILAVDKLTCYCYYSNHRQEIEYCSSWWMLASE